MRLSHPNVNGGLHQDPIGVSGPAHATAAAEKNLDGDAWTVTLYDSPEALEKAIQDRDITGGIALGAEGVDVYTATAAGPLSGLATGPHWLPPGWAALGQALPPGAFGSLLRANAFFDGTGALVPALTLTAWAALGLALALIADRRGRTSRTATAQPEASVD